jgi:hypothetical protein
VHFTRGIDRYDPTQPTSARRDTSVLDSLCHLRFDRHSRKPWSTQPRHRVASYILTSVLPYPSCTRICCLCDCMDVRPDHRLPVSFTAQAMAPSQLWTVEGVPSSKNRAVDDDTETRLGQYLWPMKSNQSLVLVDMCSILHWLCTEGRKMRQNDRSMRD